MKKNSITEFELERQDSKIRLKRGLNGGASATQSEDYVPAIPAPMQPAVFHSSARNHSTAATRDDG